MEFIRVTKENIATEHICCAIAGEKDCQVMSKKSWLKERMDEGLVFLKGDVRGKCFIEYMPAEAAWAPINAESYMYINCLWVSGQYKGQGYSNMLLETCIQESKDKGKKGLVILSSTPKKGYLADAKYLKYKGFQMVDTTAPYFELMYLPFVENAPKPSFKQHLKTPENDALPKGFTLYYTSQCPFNAKYIPLLADMAHKRNITWQSVHITTQEQAQYAPTPFTTFGLFYDGVFITHEILSEKKFEKILMEMGL